MVSRINEIDIGLSHQDFVDQVIYKSARKAILTNSKDRLRKTKHIPRCSFVLVAK